MKKIFFIATVLCLTFLNFSKLEACDLCAVYNANHASSLEGAGWTLGVAEQFTHYGTLKMDSEKVDNTLNQSMDSSITQLFANRDFNSYFGLQVTLPIITRSYTRATGHGSEVESGSVTGLGDLSVLARFQPYFKKTENFNFNWHVNVGLKFPTGAKGRIAEELEEHEHEMEDSVESGIHGHDLALGSGSLDAIVGTNIHLRSYRFLFTSDVQYSLRSEGAYDYRYANDLNWNVGAGAYLFLKDNFTLALLGKVSGEHKGLDKLAGVAAEDTGITTLALGPDFLFTWKNNFSTSLGADIPVLIHNTALQAVADYRIRSAFTWRF